MKTTYNGHKITITSARVSPEKWDLRIELTWSENGTSDGRRFLFSHWFDTAEEAETYGFTWVKKWIDKNTPVSLH